MDVYEGSQGWEICCKGPGTLLMQPSPTPRNKVLLRNFYLWWFITGPLNKPIIPIREEQPTLRFPYDCWVEVSLAFFHADLHFLFLTCSGAGQKNPGTVGIYTTRMRI